MRKFEILLPLYYNDGRRIEEEKFTRTDEEFVAEFGSTSTDSVVVSGRWKYQGTRYDDRLIRIRIDAEDTPENTAFIRKFKETLKTRFDQKDIWITAQQIDVI